MQPPFQSVRAASSKKEYWARLHDDNDVIFVFFIIINIRIPSLIYILINFMNFKINNYVSFQ
jgi:hypothetical protein